MAAVCRRLALTAVLAGMPATAACSATAAPHTTAPRAATSAPASAAVPAGPPAGLPRAEGAIPGTTADSIAHAWATYWHATPASSTQQGVQTTRLTVDFPSAHGKLYMVISRPSPGATAAGSIYCEISDASLGLKGYIAMTRAAAEQLVSGCAGPALKGDEAKQVTDYVASHDKPDRSIPCAVPGTGGTCRSSDHRTELARFQLVTQTGPGRVRLYLLGRKAGAGP
jgi:hypothetical protein